MSDFKIFTGLLKAAELDGRKIISTTASSSVVDRHGDQITPDAIRSMASQAMDSRMTIFLNHEYRVPEDIFGSVISAAATSKPNGVWELQLGVEVDETNPRALATYKQLRGKNDDGKGIKLGVSIGALIKDYELLDAKDFFSPMVIKDVELLEASIVGIPANPDSWVKQATKSLRKSLTSKPESDEAEGPDVLDLLSRAADSSTDAPMQQQGVASRHSHTHGHGDMEHDHEHEHMHQDGEAHEHDGHDHAHSDPDHDGDNDSSPEGDTDHDYAGKSVATEPEGDPLTSDEPDTLDALDDTTKSIDEEQTASPAELPTQEQPVPAEQAAAEPDADELAVIALTNKVMAFAEKLGERDRQIAELTKQRDDAVASLRLAMKFVEKLARTPLGRKTSFSAPISEFRSKFGGVYDEEFLAFLEKKNES